MKNFLNRHVIFLISLFFVTGLKKRFAQFMAAQSFFIICCVIYKLSEEKIDKTYDDDNLYNVKGFFGNRSKTG